MVNIRHCDRIKDINQDLNLTMNISQAKEERAQLNQLMADNDAFFQQFGQLDDDVYAAGAIPKKYKELTGLSISVLSRCEECILYHLQGAIKAGANKAELIEAIKMGVIGGGSITYPSARYAFKLLQELGIIDKGSILAK